MLIREMSDLHLEFNQMDLPIIENESEITLILAGDIGLAEKPNTFIPFLTEMGERHKRVIMIMGNHEHYHTSFQRSFDKINDALPEHLTNIHVMEKETFIEDDVAVICATMWTDCNKQCPHSIWKIQTYMSDYKVIRNGPATNAYQRKLSPHDTIHDHQYAVKYIFENIKKQKEAGRKVVVVTHHAPSSLSIAAHYKDDHYINGGYHSRLENQIMDTNPDMWFHGHMHNSFDYTLGETRVICNPRGYYPEEVNPDFTPSNIIEI